MTLERRRTLVRIAGVSLCLFYGTASQAQSAGDYAFGDWNGEREKLIDKGVNLNVSYGSEIAHNQTGGDKQLTRNAGQLVLDGQFDLNKLFGWNGATFRMTITERDGNNLNQDAGINSLMQSQEVYGRNQTWRLSQFWYGQDLFDQKLQIKVGRLAVGEDFSSFECTFMSLAFCGDQSGNLVGYYWYNSPVSQWGALAQVNFTKDVFLKVGAYQVNPSYLETRHTLAINPGGTTGALFPVELGWIPTLAGDLKGSYVVGGWYTNTRQADVYSDVNEDPAGYTGLDFRQRTGAYGGYITLAQQLTHGTGAEENSGLRGFFNATQADRSTSTNDREIAVGAIYHGTFASRPSDEIGLALGVTHVNSRVADYRRERNRVTGSDLTTQGNEFTAELFYGVQVARWLSLRPNVQWIGHPGGYTDRADAYVIGVKSSISF